MTEMTLDLISYGLGRRYIAKKFEPISNRQFIKPDGGLWASPADSKWGWADWCKAESFGDLTTHFTFGFTGNVFVIDSTTDAAKMPWVKIHAGIDLIYPDFEKMAQLYDAILLTENGERQTRFARPYSLYGWDCESVLIMNPSGISAK